jgi:hypothetical protein
MDRSTSPQIEPTEDPTTVTSSRHHINAYERRAAFAWRREFPATWLPRRRMAHRLRVASAYYPAIRLPSKARVRLNADDGDRPGRCE